MKVGDLIRAGNFFCQDCLSDFDAPEDGLLCPVCGADRISEELVFAEEYDGRAQNRHG